MFKSFHMKLFLGTLFGLVVLINLTPRDNHLMKPSESSEAIHLWSDRMLYCVSEELYFSAFYHKPSQAEFSEWSTVLYIELIRWDGTKLVQSKVPVKDGFSHGSIQIPGNANSGNYYLRAYTKWMRNFPPYSYTYLPVKIINPNSPDIDTGPENDDIAGKRKVEPDARSPEGIVITGLQESYGRRQKVEFEINISNSNFFGPYCLSVAKCGDPGAMQNSFSFSPGDDTASFEGYEFLPEIMGISLSGKIIDKDSNQPVAGKRVNLSSISAPFYFSIATSDKRGFFLFSLPAYEGNYEFNISSESIENREFEMLIDNDFCNKPVTLPYTAFQLNDRERPVAKEMVINAQLDGKYHAGHSGFQNSQDNYDAFYGSPSRIIYEKDFIELTDLKEFFYELVPEVGINYSGKKPYLSMHGETNLEFYPPLILMDNIPVANDEKLLNTPCRNIERIEVINKGYVIGEYKFSGIISIYSENTDMAAMDLPENSHFFNYLLFHNSDYHFPEYPANENHSPVADRRNLLYWQPDLQLSEEHTARVCFYTSDASGRYLLTLRGIDRNDQSIFYKKAVFMVK